MRLKNGAKASDAALWRHKARLGLRVSILAISVGFSPPSLAGETQTYTYDALGRLVTVQKAGAVNNGKAHTICYDRAGNRVRYVSAANGPPISCAAPASAPTPTPTP